MTATALASYRSAMASALPHGRLHEFPLTPMDRLGLPLWTVAFVGEDGALSDGFGYGATMEAAQASAWGETVEWYWAREALKRLPRRLGTHAALCAEGLRVIDPVACCLSAGSPYNAGETVLQWIEATEYPSGAAAWVPIEFIAPRYADIGPELDPASCVAVPITNGSGAGPTFEHALAHGILELLQRDGNSVQYRALDRGIVVDLDEVRDPETRRLLAHLEAEGIELIVKLAATDFGMANVYVVGYDRELERARAPIALSACGEAVHPDREVALGKALREWASARARKVFNHGSLAGVEAVAPAGYLDAFEARSLRSEDPRALAEMRRWMTLTHREFFEELRDPIFSTRERVRFSDLPTTPVKDARELLSFLEERLKAEGLPMFYVDFSPPESAATILKVLVPGLEVETMTYERIGERNVRRLEAAGSPIVRRDGRGKLVRLVAGDEVWLDSQALGEAMGRFYALYREPGRHVLGLLERGVQG